MYITIVLLHMQLYSLLILFRAFKQSIKTTAFANTSFEPYKILLNNYLITY